MNQWIIFIEVLVSLWYVREIVFISNDSIFIMIMLLLLYLCMKVIYYIFEKNKNSKYLLLIISLLLLISGLNLFNPLLYFLGYNTYQGIRRFNKWCAPFAFIALLGGFVISSPYLNSYILITIFSILISHREESMNDTTLLLKASNQELKDEIYNNKVNDSNKDQSDLTRIHASRLEERNDIAQKLHDELGHTLSGSTMQLEASLMVLADSPEQSKAIIKRVIKNLRDGTESIRYILKEIKPETASLSIQSIKTLVDETEANSGVNIKLIYDSNVIDLDHKTWQVIIVNIKEAMTNMMKYSNATQCFVSFTRMNKVYKITIHDNGIGAMVIKQNMGLLGMKERLTAMNGQLVVDGSDGFSVIMLIPIERNTNVN